MTTPLIGVFDLSIVTDALIALITKYRDESPIWTSTTTKPTIDITGAAPDAGRVGADCVLSVYLFHVATDKYQRNTPLPLRPPVVSSPSQRLRVPPIPFQPLALDLYYLVTAWAGSQYVTEQRAMSIALKALYENPTIHSTVHNDDRIEGLTLTMEMETWDEMGRLWQAVTTPARLAAVYKVSAVFIAPEALTDSLAPPPATIDLTVGTAGAPALGGAFAGGKPLPLLTPVASAYTIRGAGFVSGVTNVVVDDGGSAVPLQESTGAPSPGEFAINSDGTSIEFQLPSGLQAGEHAVHVQVNGAELPPAWLVKLP